MKNDFSYTKLGVNKVYVDKKSVEEIDPDFIRENYDKDDNLFVFDLDGTLIKHKDITTYLHGSVLIPSWPLGIYQHLNFCKKVICTARTYSNKNLFHLVRDLRTSFFRAPLDYKINLRKFDNIIKFENEILDSLICPFLERKNIEDDFEKYNSLFFDLNKSNIINNIFMTKKVVMSGDFKKTFAVSEYLNWTQNKIEVQFKNIILIDDNILNILDFNKNGSKYWKNAIPIYYDKEEEKLYKIGKIDIAKNINNECVKKKKIKVKKKKN